MEFIFELILEIIMEPIIDGYVLAMTIFADNSKKIDEEKVKYFVVFEAIVLLIVFVIGGVMLLETEGSSTWGKVLLLSSVAVSVIQISFGCILKILKKKK